MEKRKRKEKEKEKEGERKREIRGEPFGGDHDAGRARAAVAAVCRGFGGKWRARIEGNRGTEWRLDPGVGTGVKISGVRVQVLGGFELNDENNFENNILMRDLIWWIFQDVTKRNTIQKHPRRQ